jgi:hypothetical protein
MRWKALCTGSASDGGPVIPASIRSSDRVRSDVVIRSHAP